MSVNFGFSLPALRQYGAAGSNPFGQLGPTLDLSFVDGATGVTDLSNPTGYTLNTNFITPEYQVAAQYAVWVANVGLTQKNFADIVTFTRASTGTYFNSAGTLTTAAINEARFDYNPSTLAAQGLLIEEARTNSIRNNTMVGAANPSTPPTNWSLSPSATATFTVVGTGTENGITYIEIQLADTAAAQSSILFEAITQVVAADTQTWTNSFYFRRVSGGASVTYENRMVFRTSAGAAVTSQNIAFSPSTSAISTQRYANTFTAVGATIARVTGQIALTTAGADTFTFRIGLPQLEQGAFATSVIPTTTTALTRAADVASVNTLSPWFNSINGTIYAEFLRNTTPAASTFPQMVNIHDGTTNNRLALFTNSARNLRGQVTIGGVFTTIATANAYSEGIVSKLALGYEALNHATVANGGTPATNTAVGVPAGLTAMRLGDQADGFGPLNGYLRRITYYPRRLSNADLQTITT
jgi:hypothetical protein